MGRNTHQLSHIILSFLGLYLYNTGFFLTRTSIPTVTECILNKSFADYLSEDVNIKDASRTIKSDVLSISSFLYHLTTPTKCANSLPPLAHHLDIIIVDALRYDFLPHLTFPSLYSGTTYRFLSEPPTVTTQRLTAMTTGGVPTFIDVAQSFSAAKVEEDNWLTRLDVGEGGQ
jgi:hypothetical protein